MSTDGSSPDPQEFLKSCTLSADPPDMRRTQRSLRSLRNAITACSIISVAIVGVIAVPVPAQADRVAAPAAATGYTVRDGDTLFGIARKLGVRLGRLLQANGFTLDSAIHPGDQLVVPAGATVPVTTSATITTPTTTYVVKAGEGLAGIAATHGLKLGALLKANHLRIDSMVFPGTTLTIPAGGTPVVSPAPAAPATPAAAGPATAATPATPATPAVAPATTYVVVAGDGLSTIASRHGLKLGAVLKANNLRIDSMVFPGTTLTIPAGGTLVVSLAPAAPGPATPATPAAPAPTQAAPSLLDTVLAFARAQLGKPYLFFSAGPEAYDCSGLTLGAYQQIGISLPHQSAAQSTKGTAVDWRAEAIRPGDLVFGFSSSNTTVISHVGIAISATQWIHAPRAGDVVKLGTIPSADRIQAVRRFVPG